MEAIVTILENFLLVVGTVALFTGVLVCLFLLYTMWQENNAYLKIMEREMKQHQPDEWEEQTPVVKMPTLDQYYEVMQIERG